ncbi:MAG: substrate-binding domain-containing protein [Ruminococcus sp.]|nr:substrate-binding domain-containing protein [Ruminococcus sp.]
MKKITKQIAVLAAVVLGFSAFDMAIFNICTKPCIPDQSESMKAKSIELDKYLPFDKDSGIVNVSSDFRISEDIPVIDGAAALYPVFSAFVNSVYPENSVDFDGTDFTAESRLQMRNTRTAYKAIVDGDADIIICAEPSLEQLQYASDNSVELEFVPIGYDAFVFLVNNGNPVENLTSEQIRGIYSGKYKNWSELGGKNIPINALTRNSGSGSQTAMLSFMNGTEIKKNPLGFLGSPIGFSFRYYAEDVVNNGNIRMLSVDGIYPDKEHIADGSYPISDKFYAVYNKNNNNKNILPLIEWILSPEGQYIIENTGYIPI